MGKSKLLRETKLIKHVTKIYPFSLPTDSVIDMIFDLLSDRKSTRLNSSHQIISYAVFCLKKQSIISTQTYNSTTTNKTLSLHDALPISQLYAKRKVFILLIYGKIIYGKK